MKHKITFILFTLLLTSTISFSQNFEQVYTRAKELYDSAQLRKTDTALILCRQLAKSQFGENSLKYAEVLSLSGNLFFRLDKFEQSDSLLTQAINIFNFNNDNSSAEYIKTLSRYGYYTNNFDIILCQQAVDIAKKQFGENSKEYAFALNFLGRCYYNNEENNKALETLQTALNIKTQLYGENHIECARTMINLAEIYYCLSKSTEMMNYCTQTSEIIKNNIGEYNQEYAYSLCNLSLAYDLIGDYEKEIELIEKALYIYRGTLGEYYTEYLITLNNLSCVYSGNGNYNKAIEILTDLSDKKLKIYGYYSQNLATTLNNLGVCYGDIKEYNKAIDYIQQSANIRKKIYGKKSDSYAISLNNLGYYYNKISNKKQAIKNCKLSSKICKHNQGKESCDYLLSQNNIANASKLNKQIKILKQVVDISSKIFDKYHSSYQLHNYNIGIAYFEKHQYSQSIEYLSTALDINNKRLSDNFSFMSSDMKEHYWSVNQDEYPWIRKLVFKIPENEKALCSAYDGELVSKGVLLTSELQLDKVINNSGDTSLINLYNDINNLKQYISDLEEDDTENHIHECDSLRDILDKMERNLSINCRAYGDITQPLKIRWLDVKNSLKENEVAIEFIKEPINGDTIPSYGALILKKDMPYPAFVSLFKENEFSKYFNDYNIFDNLNDTILYSIIWKPIEKYLNPNNKIYFSPIGILTQTPIEFAFLNSKSTISDKYDIYRVSSTRNIAMSKNHVDISDAIIYGGINYDADSTSMVMNNSKYRGIELFKNIDLDYISKLSLQASYLLGSDREMSNIASMLKQGNIECTKLSYNEATEESFKALSGNSPNIIHIATHGFFIQPDSVEISNEDALNLTGLLFAGCNTTWNGVKLPEGVDDGILLSKEISNLDLRNTDLVVLSACKTGTGLTDNEGVFGLQRGFIKSGVHTLIMSLWDVDDNATLLLMTNFYKHLSAGENKHEAFKSAVRYLHSYLNMSPEFWSAFIMLD